MDTAQIAEALAAFPEVVLVYVFGSRATGRASTSSDLDLAVVTDRGTSWPRFRTDVVTALRPLLGDIALDLVNLNRAPVELSNAVLTHGVRIFERSVAERVEFEAHVSGRYGDYLPVLRQQQREILNGGDRDARARRYRTQVGRAGRASLPLDRAAEQAP